MALFCCCCLSWCFCCEFFNFINHYILNSTAREFHTIKTLTKPIDEQRLFAMESNVDGKSENNSVDTEIPQNTTVAQDRVGSAASCSTTSNGPSGIEEAFQVVVRVRPSLGRKFLRSKRLKL